MSCSKYDIGVANKMSWPSNFILFLDSVDSVIFDPDWQGERMKRLDNEFKYVDTLEERCHSVEDLLSPEEVQTVFLSQNVFITVPKVVLSLFLSFSS